LIATKSTESAIVYSMFFCEFCAFATDRFSTQRKLPVRKIKQGWPAKDAKDTKERAKIGCFGLHLAFSASFAGKKTKSTSPATCVTQNRLMKI
jgi:hypothetical protein